METIFKDWRIDGYTADSNDGKYRLWIANGFISFRDCDCHFPRQSLLVGIGIFKRYKIWRQLVKERKLRANDFLSKI